MNRSNLIFPDLPVGYFWDPFVEKGDEIDRLSNLVWPSYLSSYGDMEDPPPHTSLTDQELENRMQRWGIRLSSNQRLVAFANGALIPVDCTTDFLPDDGWHFGLNARYSSESPTALCLLSANVHPDFRNLRFSSCLLNAAKAIAKEKNLKHIIVPVRPSKKSDFPDLSIEQYLNKKTDDGFPFDPWLRTHVRLGAEILNICHRSVVAKGSVAKWQEWLNRKFSVSGSYSIPEGLVQLKIDIERNIGIYCEPNVWVRYKL